MRTIYDKKHVFVSIKNEDLKNQLKERQAIKLKEAKEEERVLQWLEDKAW